MDAIIPALDWREGDGLRQNTQPLARPVAPREVVLRPADYGRDALGLMRGYAYGLQEGRDVEPDEDVCAPADPLEWARALYDTATVGQACTDIIGHYLVTLFGEVVEGRDLALVCARPGPEVYADNQIVVTLEPGDDVGGVQAEVVLALVSVLEERLAAPLFFPERRQVEVTAGGTALPDDEDPDKSKPYGERLKKELVTIAADRNPPIDTKGMNRDQIAEALTEWDAEHGDPLA